jgi:predicted AlkP superfamily pyrophosphatase or phosphodiesterase
MQTPDDSVNGTEPVIPDYEGGCISNLVAALAHDHGWPWVPAVVNGARQVVLLVLDGLGWDQFEANAGHLPTLSSFTSRSITSVIPSTTAAALTSISTGVPPGDHGIVGYRMLVDGEVLNTLRWWTGKGDARRSIPPESIQPRVPFGGRKPVVITKGEFNDSGFTRAHLGGTRLNGWRTVSALITNVAQALRAGEPFVYAYYDGIDKVSHEYGLGEHYRGELEAADAIVAAVQRVLPPGAALVVTADHGQVHTGDDVRTLHADVIKHVSFQSGEGRFRWLHAKPGRTPHLVDAAREHHSSEAWIYTRDEARDLKLFGPRLPETVGRRLGDVCLAATGEHAFFDPTDTGAFQLVGRHGSLTRAEMLVPMCAYRAEG